MHLISSAALGLSHRGSTLILLGGLVRLLGMQVGLRSNPTSAEEIRCVFDDNKFKDNFCQIFIKTYVVGAH